jgi:hypothetical protein
LRPLQLLLLLRAVKQSLLCPLLLLLVLHC